MNKVKIFFIFFISLFFVQLSYAAVYKSNGLGQILGQVDSDTEYFLYVEDTISILKKDNIPIFEFSTTNNDNILTKSILDLTTKLKTSYLYKDGLLNQIITQENDNTINKLIFTYEDNSLICTTLISDNNESTMTDFYIRSSNDGELIGTKKFLGSTLNGTSYLIEDTNLYYQINNKLVLNTDFSINEDGTYNYIKDNTKYVYSTNGLMLSSEKDSVSTKYYYDENNLLIKTEEISKEKKVISFFESQILLRTEEYGEDGLSEINKFNVPDFGKIKTIYTSGIPVADVYYSKDKLKVLKIEYLD